MTASEFGRSPFLIMRLLEGWDWFESRLREQLHAHGYRSFNKTQSMVIIYVANGMTRPSDIARQISLTRQAVQNAVHQLCDAGILEMQQDPNDKRAKVLGFNKSSQKQRRIAEKIFRLLEEQLKERIGTDDMRALHRILKSAWKDDAPPYRAAKGTQDLEQPQA